MRVRSRQNLDTDLDHKYAAAEIKSHPGSTLSVFVRDSRPSLSFIDLTMPFFLVDGIASTTTQAKPLGLEVEDPPDTTIRLCDV